MSPASRRILLLEIPMPTTLHIGLRFKLVCMVAGALAIAAIVAALMLRQMLYQNMIQEKKTIVDIVTTSIVHDIKYEYLQGRENPLSGGIISKYITYYRIIKRISLYDSQLINIADSEPGYVSTTTQDPDIIQALSIAKPTVKVIELDENNLAIYSIAPILRGSKINAAVILDISIQDIRNSLAAINYRIGLIFIITVIISSIFITIMLRRSILPRLEHLIRITREIAAGNYKIRVNDNRGDEIGQLAQAFNQMTGDLQKSKQALEAYHSQNFEQKVQELHRAYKELENTQSQLVHNEKMASLGLLVAGIAHEINTPLGAISNVSRSIGKRANLLPDLFNTFLLQENPSTPLAVECLHELVSLPACIQNFPSFKEIQAIENLLCRAGVDNWREVTRALVNLNLTDTSKLEKYLDCFRNPTLFHLIEAVGIIIQGVKITETSCTKVQEIIRALKYYAYLDKAKVQPIQVNESIQTALVLLRNKLKYKVNIIADLDPDIPLIQCTSEIHQIWTNLLNNAYDAIVEMGDNYAGQIVVSSCTIDDHIMVTVSDNGIGIPENKLGNIFDPFFTTKDIGKGTGLGLSIVSGIIRRHNGTIRVKQLQGPTIFEVLLPLKGEPVIEKNFSKIN